jgi:hypothetical protein
MAAYPAFQADERLSRPGKSPDTVDARRRLEMFKRPKAFFVAPRFLETQSNNARGIFDIRSVHIVLVAAWDPGFDAIARLRQDDISRLSVVRCWVPTHFSLPTLTRRYLYTVKIIVQILTVYGQDKVPRRSNAPSDPNGGIARDRVHHRAPLHVEHEVLRRT